jgi:phospholipid/cholesterol/gamma-HCH transport system substrate-binding protein
MKRENVNYFAVGIFVVAMLIMFMAVLYQITGRAGPTDSYQVFLGNVTGLKRGTPVFYEGYQVGQVEQITPEREAGQTRYRLELTLPAGWQVPADSVARVVSTGLLSAVTVDIQEGESRQFLEPGDTLQGKQGVGMMSMLDGLGADFKDLSENGLKPLLANANELVTSVSRLVDEAGPGIAGGLRATLSRLNDSAGRLQDVLNAHNRDNIATFLANMRAASEDTVVVADQARSAAERLAVLAKDLQDTRARLDGVLGNADGLVSETRPRLRAAVVSLHHSLDAVAQHIDTVAYNLETTSRNLSEFSREIRQNPSLLLNSTPARDQVRTQR